MVYLLALILPMTFLYSPAVEKTGPVFFAKPMVITQERKSPAYDVYRQSQTVLQIATAVSDEPTTESLQTVNLNAAKNNSQDATIKISELVIDQKELLQKTDTALKNIVASQTDSTLLSTLQSSISNSAPQFTAAQFAATQSNAATIRGQFELSEGVGIVDHIVSLRRVFEGQSVELGEVDLKAGLYQILVGSFEGELIAEIKDRSGIVIGEDRQKIWGLKRTGLFFSGPLLKIGQPSSFGFNARKVDDRKITDANIDASFFSGNYSLKKTTDTYPNVASLSSTIGLIADRTGQVATTLSVRTAKDSSETLLFTKNWVDGLQTYLSDRLQIQYQKSAGLIIGRLIQDGKPLAGAQVVVENQPGLEPYYLDQFLIPQISQTVTSSNGLFVIPGLNTGRYQISAFIKDRHLGQQIYFVEESVVAYQEIISTAKTQSVIVRTFDAFTGEPADADLTLPGHEDLFAVVDGLARYRTSALEGLQEILVRPVGQGYTNFTYLQNSKKDHLHLPLIQDHFLDQLRLKKQIPQLPNTSVFIAFTPAINYDLHLTAENFDLKQILYFDSQGRATSAPTLGGGFVIYNLPEGLQEIILQDKTTDRTYSQVVHAESSKNYVAHFFE